MKYFSLTKILLGVASLIVMGAAYCADIQAPVGYSTGDSSQQPIVYTEKNGTELHAFNQDGLAELSILRPGAMTATISLPDDILYVTRISEAVGDKAVLVGMVNESLSEIVVVDLARGEIFDTFIGYDPVISPNGKLIAFTKFYPTHAVAGTSDFVMLYDLTKPASINRPAEKPASEDTDVGEAVYPTNITASSPNTDLPDADVVHVTSDFFWSADSSKLAFSTEQALQEQQTVTVPHNGPSLRRKQINVVLVSPGVASGRTKTFQAGICTVGRGACADRMIGVTFDTDSVAAGFEGYNPGAKRKSLHINYAQFAEPK